MTGKVRVGVSSTSWWADMMFLPSLKSHPQAEIAALCGRNYDRAQEMARKYNIPTVFTDYREMIEKGDLDAIVVATPDDLHYPMTMEALDAGLHVLCEKPMALNAKQAREMLDKAVETGVVHMLLFTYRWLPHYRYLKELIDEGYLGRCYQCSMSFLLSSGRSIDEYYWMYDRHRSTGQLAGIGSHMFDLARWFIGDITQLSAHLTSFTDRPGIDGPLADPTSDSIMVAAQFENGAQGLIQLSSMAHIGDRRAEMRIVLYGELGTLEADLAFTGVDEGIRLRGARHNEDRIVPLSVPDRILENVNPTDLLDPFVKQSVGPRLFIDAILTGKSASPDFFDGLKAQEIIDACIESDRRKCWVSV